MADRKRILIADDDPDLLSLLEMALAGEGYAVAAVSDGKEAFSRALSETFDVVLLDIMMPYIDGYHVAYELTSRLGPRAPKILLMTSRDTAREQGVALISGAEEVLQKPFELAALKQTIARLLETTQPSPP